MWPCYFVCYGVFSYVNGLFRKLRCYFLFYGGFFTWSCLSAKYIGSFYIANVLCYFVCYGGLFTSEHFTLQMWLCHFICHWGFFTWSCISTKYIKFILDCKCDRVISVISYVMGFFSRGVVLSTKYIGYKNMLHNAHCLIKWY